MKMCRNRKGQFTSHDYIETGSVGYFKDTKDCGYGCKIHTCKHCGDWREVHYSSYGCTKWLIGTNSYNG